MSVRNSTASNHNVSRWIRKTIQSQQTQLRNNNTFNHEKAEKLKVNFLKVILCIKWWIIKFYTAIVAYCTRRMFQIKVFCFTSQIADMFFVQVADRHLRDVLFATIWKPNSFPLMNEWMAIQDWLWPILDHFWAPWKKVWHFIRCKQASLIKPLSKEWLQCKRNYRKSIIF